jgi:acetyltransferase-like isoleucine patch superfamily enzyme
MHLLKPNEAFEISHSTQMNKLIFAFRKSKHTKTPFIPLVLTFLYYRIFYKKSIIVHPHTKIYGQKNLKANGELTIGLNNTGHSHPCDKTVLNVEGQLVFSGKYSVGRGSRIYIRKQAIAIFGKDGYMNNDTEINIAHNLIVGDNTVIAWKCQFLDTDFHKIEYSGKKPIVNSIRIGNRVWIGCNSRIYKGSVIADGCVVAADSVVRGQFLEPNCLIGGNPAKTLKRDITWKL